jgi:hypothetical protein
MTILQINYFALIIKEQTNEKEFKKHVRIEPSLFTNFMMDVG